MTFGELLNKYCDDVSSKKKGERWECIRIDKFQADKLSKVTVADLNKPLFADWRDRRLKEVSALSVLREWALLSHYLHIAVNEWEYLTENPMKGLKKPTGEPPRDRLITQDEIDGLCFALNFSNQLILTTITIRVGAAFMFAIETPMRAQEICNLTWLYVVGQVARINDSKTQAGIRNVPLSSRALAIIEQFKGLDEKYIFNISTSQLGSLFRKAKKLALVGGVHFHDSRATAITNLSKKLQILDLARMVGHKDLKMLMVYYRESASDIAVKLG